MTAVSYNLTDVVTADKLSMCYVNKQDRLCTPNLKVLIPCYLIVDQLFFGYLGERLQSGSLQPTHRNHARGGS